MKNVAHPVLVHLPLVVKRRSQAYGKYTLAKGVNNLTENHDFRCLGSSGNVKTVDPNICKYCR